jgi:hypothetical protein
LGFFFSNKHRNLWSGFMRDAAGAEGLSTPLRQIASESFSQHVARILHRNISNPLLK